MARRHFQPALCPWTTLVATQPYSASSAPTVGVVIPCFDSAPYVRAAVESVLSQTLQPTSCVVVDDGSTDDPRSMLEDLLDQTPTRFVRQSNAGVAAARNRGADSVDASYLLFLDADDVLERTMLATLVSHLEANDAAVAVFSQATAVDATGKELAYDWPPRWKPSGLRLAPIPDDEPRTPFSAIFAGAPMIPSLTVMRSEAFEAVGRWDETFGQHYEDTHLYLRLAMAGDIHYVAERLVRHRRHERQSTADLTRYGDKERALGDHWRQIDVLPEEQRRVVLDAWKMRERRLIPMQAATAAWGRLEHARVADALRIAGGATRVAAGSLLRRGRPGATS